MGVAGHGVPVAARLQAGHAHGQLAGLQHAGMDELVDGALVAGLQAAQGTLGGLLQGDQLGLVAAVCRGGDHVELGGMLGVIALEGDLLGALGNVQAVFDVQVIFHTVGRDGAGAVTNVEDADLAALQEVMGAEVGPDVDALVDGNFLMYRHAAQGDHAVHVAVNGHDLISLVQAGDQHLIADFLGGVALKIALIAGIADVHKSESSLPLKRMFFALFPFYYSAFVKAGKLAIFHKDAKRFL